MYRSIIYKIEEWSREVKFGFQRMFRGYDDTAYWGLDTYLAEMLIPIFEWYRDNDPHMMLKGPGEEDYCTKAEQEQIYNHIITAFREILYDDVAVMLEDDYNIQHKNRQARIKRGLQLFVKHYQGFWT